MPAQPDFDSDDEDAGQTIWEKLWQSAGYRHNDEGDYVKVVSCSVLALCSEGRCGRLMHRSASGGMAAAACHVSATVHTAWPANVGPLQLQPTIVFSSLRFEWSTRLQVVHRVLSSILGPVDPSFRALSGRLQITVRRYKFNTYFFLIGARGPAAAVALDLKQSVFKVVLLTPISSQIRQFIPYISSSEE